MRLWPGRGSVILFWNDSAQTLFVKKSFGGGGGVAENAVSEWFAG